MLRQSRRLTLSIHPWHVVVQNLNLSLARKHIKGDPQHFWMADIVDHHVIVAWNGHDGIYSLYDVRCLQVIKIVKSTIDTNRTEIDALWQ